MKKFSIKILFLLSILCSLYFVLWAGDGHFIISGYAQFSLNKEIINKYPGMPGYMTDHASDPDYRKSKDPTESPKHFIDLDTYPEFVQNGYINRDYTYNVNSHGINFVISNGTLPWAILNTYDSLKISFKRNDINKINLFASDLGHYIGDMHMPLHLCENYDGQLTGQRGIHSRYETALIQRFYSKINFTGSLSNFIIENIPEYIFNRMYSNFNKRDSLLNADLYAYQKNGNTYSDAYYDTLWSLLNNMTINLMKDGSKMLANIINTAYYEASINVIANIDNKTEYRLLQNYPNPFNPSTVISFQLPAPGNVTLKVYDPAGKEIKTMINENRPSGKYETVFHADQLSSGTYYYILSVGNYHEVRRMIYLK